MSNALNMTISHFEKLHETSTEPVNVDGLRSAREHLANADLSIKQMGGNIESADSSQKGFNNTLKSTDSIVKQITSRFSAVYIITRTLRKFKKEFDNYTGYSGLIAELEGVTGANEKQLESFKQMANHLGTTTMYSINEVIDGMSGLSRGGLNMNQVFSSIPHVVDFATASKMNMNEAGKVLINTMKGFNLTGRDSQRILDVIAHAGNTSTAEISEMGQAFREVSSIAEMLNVSLEETAVLLKAGSPIAVGRRAGRMVREGLSRLGSLRKPVQDMLSQLEVEVIDTTTNEIKNIGTIINDINEAFNRLNLSKTAQGQALEQIFGVRNKAVWMEIVNMGQVEWDKMLNEMENSSEGFAENLADIMLRSTEGTMKLYRNQVEGVWIEFYDSLSENTVIAESFRSVLNTLVTTLKVVLRITTGLITVFGVLFNVVDTLLPLIGALAISYALLSFNGLASLKTTIMNNIAEGKSIISKGILAGQNLYLAGTIMVTTIATEGLAVAMWTLPTTWIIAGIIAIIGLLYAVVKAYNKLYNASKSATGMIVGGIFEIGAILYNVVMFSANLVISFAETVINIAIDIKNWFSKVWYEIRVVITDFVISALDKLQALDEGAIAVANSIGKAFVDAFNWIVGKAQSISFDMPDWMVDKLGVDKTFTLLGDVDLKEYKPIEAPTFAEDLKAKIKYPEPPKLTDHVEFDEFEYKNLDDAFDKGYKIGENFANSVSDLLDFESDLFDTDGLLDDEGYGEIKDILDNIGNALPEMGDSLGGIKDDTKDINKVITEDDLQYLTDIGTRRAISRHTSQEVRVEIVNYNDISSDMDVDGVINTMVDGLEEYISVGRDGA